MNRKYEPVEVHFTIHFDLKKISLEVNSLNAVFYTINIISLPVIQSVYNQHIQTFKQDQHQDIRIRKHRDQQEME